MTNKKIENYPILSKFKGSFLCILKHTLLYYIQNVKTNISKVNILIKSKYQYPLVLIDRIDSRITLSIHYCPYTFLLYNPPAYRNCHRNPFKDEGYDKKQQNHTK